MRYILFLLLIIFSVSGSVAQRDTTFWFVAPDVSASHEDRPVRFRLSTEDQPAVVTISQPANPSFSTITISIPANSSRTHTFPNSQLSRIENSPANQILNKGFLIQSTGLITVYYEVGIRYNIDIFTLKGRNALGKHYIIPGQNFWNNQVFDSHSTFEIVASENNTIVSMVPTVNIVGHNAGDTVSILLQKGQTYSARALSKSSSQSLGGSLVVSNKPIAITLSDDSLFETPCYDLTGDQLVPVGILGQEYIVQKGELNVNEKVFITSVFDDTQISVNGVPLGSPMSARQIKGIGIAERNYIEASKPVYVMQYTGIGCEMGAALIPSINCKGSNQIAFTRSDNNRFIVNLIVKNGGQHNFQLNGSTTAILSTAFDTVPGTNKEWMSANINFTTQQIRPGNSYTVSNSSHSFQLGFLDGGGATGARFGYFSNFSSLFIGDDITLCEGETRTIVPKGDDGAHYTWSDGSTGASLEVSEAGKYWVSTINSAGCELSDTLEVFVNPTHFLSLPESVTVCKGERAILDAGKYFSYKWSNGYIGRRLSVKEPGMYSVEVTNFNGCTDQGQIEAIFVDPPALNLGNDLSVCPDNPIVLSSNITDAESYSWSDLSTGTSLSVSDSGLYWLEIKKDVCTVRDSIRVRHFPKPSLSEISGSISVCPGVEHIDYQVEKKGNLHYQWAVEGGLIDGPATHNTVKVNWGESNANARVKLVETNEFGCKSDTSGLAVRVNVFLETEQPKGDAVLCYNEATAIPYSIDKTNGSVYNWTASAGTIVSGQGTNSVLVDWHETGHHTLLVNESSTTKDYICYGQSPAKTVWVYKDTTKIELNLVSVNKSRESSILVNWTARNAEVVDRFTLFRKNMLEDNWQEVISFDTAIGTFEDTGLNTTNEVYEYKIIATNHCNETVTSPPHNSMVLSGTANEEKGKISLQWNPYSGWPEGVVRYEIERSLENTNSYEVIESTSPTNLAMQMTNAADGFQHRIRIKAVSPDQSIIAYSNSIHFEFEHQLTIPNAFSPNSDGINDTFVIPKIALYEGNQLIVFDRTGKTVYQANNYQSDWDGGDLPAGTYFYSLSIPVNKQVLRGTVSILK